MLDFLGGPEIYILILVLKKIIFLLHFLGITFVIF